MVETKLETRRAGSIKGNRVLTISRVLSFSGDLVARMCLHCVFPESCKQESRVGCNQLGLYQLRPLLPIQACVSEYWTFPLPLTILPTGTHGMPRSLIWDAMLAA